MRDTTLPYEPTRQDLPVVIDRQGDLTRIVVAMYGPYAPVPRWVGELDLLTVVVFPIWALTGWAVRSIFGIAKPPRAVFEINADRFKIELRNQNTGELITLDVPRSAVVAARANRFEHGLWLDIPGKLKESWLTEMPSGRIEKIEAALNEAMGR